MNAEKRLCSSCKTETVTGENHSCPFASEICKDYDEKYCNCCEKCERICLLEI